MKSIKTTLLPGIFCLIFVLYFIGCKTPRSKTELNKSDNYDVAAYIWPSCHDEQMSNENLWSEGIGEWEMIKKGNPRFEGHYQQLVGTILHTFPSKAKSLLFIIIIHLIVLAHI
ncbi:MAG: glycoside hydrolase family 99-like domain-containing protein [Draconibacterium sp.]|nr:glycoside hydrolase family 99-like domain-containing protein [Draconibacterium sp.]